MALYVLGGEILCSQAFCPHLAGPLFQGTVSRTATGHAVTCPWHRWRFDLRHGARLDPPAPGEQLGAALVCCEVVLGERGTILIRPPRTALGEP
jgi:nitrite reductase/ring-hydroxylating ferredoxin subunit